MRIGGEIPLQFVPSDDDDSRLRMLETVSHMIVEQLNTACKLGGTERNIDVTVMFEAKFS